MNMQKKLLLPTLCLLFVCSTSSSLAMLSQKYKDQHKHAAFLQAIRQMVSAYQVDETIDRIKQQHYEECLTELEKITGIPYEILHNQFDAERILIKELLKKENAGTHHDTSLPASIYQNLCETFIDEGLNPESTTFIYKKNSQTAPQNAGAVGVIFQGIDPINLPRIVLYERLLLQPQTVQSFINRHELSHNLLQHTAMNFRSVSRDSYADRKRLISAQEKEADISAASKNSKLACTGAKYRCTFGHNDIIDNQKHCSNMLIMCALMRQKEKLALQ